MPSENTPFRVTIAVTYTSLFEGDVALGIISYSERHGRWRFAGAAGGAFTRFDELDPTAFDGIIGYFFDTPYIRQRAEEAIRAGVSAVNISNADRGMPLPRAASDEAVVGRLGAEHLLERGFTQFAFISQGDTWYSQQRLDAFRAVIERNAGRTCHVLTAPRMRGDADPALIGRWLANLPKPVAVMAATDFIGRQVVEQALAHGLRVPDDVACLGVDNDRWENALAPVPLSSIQHDLHQMGYQAAALLDRLMRGEPAPTETLRIAPVGVVSRQSTNIVQSTDPLVGRALQFIHEHCGDRIGVEDVLDELGVSRRSLEAHTKRVTGQSPKNLISRARVERAKRMLVSSSATMDQIARDCGYDGANRFHIVFKHFTGMTPGGYRRRFASPQIVSEGSTGQ